MTTRKLTRLAFGLLVALQLLRFHVQRTPIFEDDVLFFLRYADNLAGSAGRA